MRYRPVRLAAILILAGACALAGLRLLALDREIAARRDATDATAYLVRELRVALATVRADQIGYVAAGQEPGPWAERVSAGLAGIARDLASVRAQVREPAALAAIDASEGAIASLSELDARALEYAEADERLLASDLIFADGFGTVDRALDELELVEAAERSGERDATAALQGERLTILAGMALLALVIAGWLAVQPKPARAVVALDTPLPQVHDAADDVLEADPAGGATLGERPPPAPPPSETVEPIRVERTVDLAGAAAVCGDLARLVDGSELPALLGRASALLDAPGLVVWVADDERRELTPVAAHGYGDAVMARLAGIAVSADNATAAAFREARLQTVPASGPNRGAIVAPLLTHSGCVGVVTAEVPGARVDDEDTQSLALILTAQLAAVVATAAADESDTSLRTSSGEDRTTDQEESGASSERAAGYPAAR